MAYITTGVEYGLHCLALPGRPSRRELSSECSRPRGSARRTVDYVAKLFTKLQKAGLVVATEGARGGFRLARSARLSAH